MPVFKRTNSDDPDFRLLVNDLDQELCSIYGTQQEDYDAYNRITDLPTVVVDYESSRPVGCGCFKYFDAETIELKRMFVAPDVRGKGIASGIVRELERWGAELQYRFAILETGKKQPDAIGLYQKLGFQPIERYGQYSDMENSVCMKKPLETSAVTDQPA